MMTRERRFIGEIKKTGHFHRVLDPSVQQVVLIQGIVRGGRYRIWTPLIEEANATKGKTYLLQIS